MVLTKKMKRFLENFNEEYEKDKKRSYPQIPIRFCRIQKRIDRQLDNLLWLCQHHREIFLNEPNLNEYGHQFRPHIEKIGKERLKILLKCIALLTNKDVVLIKEVLKNEQA